MEKKYRCKCGGTLIVDDKLKTTAHSLPACARYMELCESATYTGLQERDANDKLVKQ